ncbi:MAG: Uma2 family endonuclease [Acidobacteriota bacterium]|nr:Uma2 family endonuclease [Acidobacteriota bacterium]
MAHASHMRVLALDSSLPEIVALLGSRRISGKDRSDEMWDGVLHLSAHSDFRHARLSQQLAELLGPLARSVGLIPAVAEFNLGDSDQDFRVPDGGLVRESIDHLYVPSAALVIEIRSPNDESWEKLPFYAAHGVDEVLIVEPESREVHWLQLKDGAYLATDTSTLIDLSGDRLAAALVWD